MKIAIPTANNLLCPHFGHCDEFTFISVNPDTKEIIDTEVIKSPEHEPGLLPRWVHTNGASLVIAGGMGVKAQHIFAENGIRVVVGAPVALPADIVRAYLDGTLEEGSNLCDH